MKTHKHGHIISLCVALMYVRPWGVSPLELCHVCVWAAQDRQSVGRRIMGINQGKAMAICLFNVEDGYCLNLGFALKQLASFHRVDSLTVGEACEHISAC